MEESNKERINSIKIEILKYLHNVGAPVKDTEIVSSLEEVNITNKAELSQLVSEIIHDLVMTNLISTYKIELKENTIAEGKYINLYYFNVGEESNKYLRNKEKESYKKKLIQQYKSLLSQSLNKKDDFSVQYKEIQGSVKGRQKDNFKLIHKLNNLKDIVSKLVEIISNNRNLPARDVFEQFGINEVD